VRIEPDKMTVDRIRQVIYYPSNDEKPRLLIGLLKHMDPRRSMVFVNTRRAAEDIEGLLQSNGINAEAISGDVPQRKRLRMLRDFHDGTLAVLIGTDVASRGLHIPDVSHVFNYDLPQDPEDYVHRIGRTARAGAEGDAISFGCEEYVMSLPDIEAYIDRKIPVAAVPQDMLPDITLPPHRSRHRHSGGPRRGGRPDHNGGGRSRPRQGPPPRRVQPQEHSSVTSAPATPDGSSASADGQGDGTKRRRRRRRGSKTAGGTTNAPAPSNE